MSIIGNSSDSPEISFIGSAANQESSGTVAVDVSGIPIQSGDLILLLWGSGESASDQGVLVASNNDLTFTVLASNPSGWSSAGAAAPGTVIHYATADGDEASFSVGGAGQDRASLCVAVFRNAQITGSAYSSGGSGAPNPPELSGFSAGDFAIALAVLDDDQAVSPPSFSGYTTATWGATQHTSVVAYKADPSSNEDPGVLNFGNDSWKAATLRLSPP